MTRLDDLADLTLIERPGLRPDVTLIDEDTKPILTLMPIKKSQAICLCMWRHLVAKFLTNASGATWWPNFLLTQVAPPGGQISY